MSKEIRTIDVFSHLDAKEKELGQAGEALNIKATCQTLTKHFGMDSKQSGTWFARWKADRELLK